MFLGINMFLALKHIYAREHQRYCYNIEGVFQNVYNHY